MSGKIVYLAGKMSGLSFEEQTKWRNEIKEGLEHTDFKVVSPTDYYNYDYPSHQSEKEVMDWELRVVSKADILIVNLNKVGTSVGTLFELATAHHLHKPIIGYGKTEGLHPWIQECLWRTENNLSDLLAYITGYFDIA